VKITNHRTNCYEIPSHRIALALRAGPVKKRFYRFMILLVLVPWSVLYIGFEILMHWFGIPHPHIGR